MSFDTFNISGIPFKQQAWDSTTYDYRYPRELRLKPGTPFHDKLLRMILERAGESHRVMQSRHRDWQETDRKLRAYVPEASTKKKDRGYDEDEVMPKIIMPVSYAILETHITYMMAAFMQPPIFRYEGVGPEDILSGLLMQHLIHQQIHRQRAGLVLHTMFRDGFAYGVGPVACSWMKEYGVHTKAAVTGVMDQILNAFRPEGRKKRRSYGLMYEGNKLDNIDPYRALPDPNVAAHDVQGAEFWGWVQRTNMLELLSQERPADSDIFNVKYLQHMQTHLSSLSEDVRGWSQRQGDRYGFTSRIRTNNPVDVVWMYVNLIPQAWDLGPGEYPEKWLFGVAADNVIIHARPTDLDHNMIPVVVAAPDFDGYSSSPISRLDTVRDIQGVIDFLYTSHIMNQRKAINDMFVVDPSLINVFDLMTPKPGKIIRSRRTAWGKGGLKDAIQQLQVQDVTAGNIQEVAYLTDFMQMTSGATDQAMGIVKQRTSRISASEIQGARSSSLSRLEKTAKVIGLQAMQPLGKMMASHVSQLMTQDTYIKVVGETEQKLRDDFGITAESERVKVSPLDILGQYDLEEHDGSIPGSQDVRTWVDVFELLTTNPVVGQQFDLVKIFTHIARQSGAKNIDQFIKRTPQVQPDEEVLEEVDRGNLVELNEAQGDGGGPI